MYTVCIRNESESEVKNSSCYLNKIHEERVIFYTDKSL
jgi:hypothetical protein